MAENDVAREGVLKAAQSLIYDGRFEEAARDLARLLSDAPNDAEALYMSAVANRYLKRFDAARAALGALKAVQPEFGRAHQEEGHLSKAEDRPDRALAAYQRACRYNPALQASWTAQAEILEAQGHAEAARQARAEADRVRAWPKPLAAAAHLLYEGKLVKAEQACRAFLQKTPHHIEGMRLLAEIGVRFGALEDADFLLESAVELEPTDPKLRLDYIQVLRKRQKFEAALAQAKALLQTAPDNPVFQSQVAIESMQTGDYQAALDYFDRVLERAPNDPATLTSRGHALKTFGRSEEAIASYRRAFTAKPGHGDAYYALANLKTYRFSDGEIEEMRRQVEQGDLSHQDRVHFCFALGKAYEDRDDPAAAFGFYAEGNELKRVQSRYSADQMDAEFEAQKEVCTPELFERHAGRGCPAPDPIFILGLPRAGSTLLEQILASHSQVDGTLELPNILSLSHRLRGRGQSRYPDVLRDLTAEHVRGFGEEFIETTRIHRKGAPFFIDKMPNNFRHIGLIRLILPNAKIIDARREPMGCCFSAFKQLFAEGQEFTYSLSDIGRYYRGYVDLMAHWDRVLPGAVLRVQHEDVVADLEGQVRRLLDFCDLPFEEACLEFHKTERAVRTASSEQVRRPINTSGLDQWRPFEPFLGPLKDALGPELAPA
ncbi:MAG: sulfotransferase [Pseudomonadota bacterium]